MTPPFRLDYTVAALQRVATNVVEVWTDDGRYVRAFETPRGPVVWEVTQRAGGASVRLRLHGAVAEVAPWRALLRRMLGTDVDLRPFYAAASRIPALAELAERFRGLKPPRFATLWESFVNTIAFQQLSLASGMASVARLARLCAPEVPFEGLALRPFPSARAVSAASEAQLRACGFSGAKVRSLRAAADAVLAGGIREEELERLDDAAATERLEELPGIGPWTASLVLLRGLRRLGTFPSGDAGAERRLRAVLGAVDGPRIVAALGPWRGMLYFHLLLASRFGREDPAAARPLSPLSPDPRARARGNGVREPAPPAQG